MGGAVVSRATKEPGRDARFPLLSSAQIVNVYVFSCDGTNDFSHFDVVGLNDMVRFPLSIARLTSRRNGSDTDTDTSAGWYTSAGDGETGSPERVGAVVSCTMKPPDAERFQVPPGSPAPTENI